MPMKKHVIERYRNYTIYIVSGTNPALFIAEKNDPAKGATLTGDSVDELKQHIDNMLKYAISVHINIWDGPEQNRIYQNPKTTIKSLSGNLIDTFAIVIESNYDMDVIIEMMENRKLRQSKKHRKNHRVPLNILRIMCRARTTNVKQ